MNEPMTNLLIIVFMASVVGVIYPFWPFGNRKRALGATFGSFIAIGIAASAVEPKTETASVGSAVASLAPESHPEDEATPDVATVKVDEGKPTVADTEELRANVRDGKYERARVAFTRFASRGLDATEIAVELEPVVLAAVLPLPASDHTGNLEGYKLLAAIDPENAVYEGKIAEYDRRLQEACRAPLRGLNKKTDKVSGVDFYEHPNEPRFLNSRSTVYLYIGQNHGSPRPYLRMKVQYTANTWLFVDSVTAYHDGISEPLVGGGFERDNNTSIWEWVDEAPDGYQVEVLRSLAGAREAILRYEGSQYRKDVTLSSGDKAALRDVLAAYDAMNGGC
jgi:hypothetical protein